MTWGELKKVIGYVEPVYGSIDPDYVPPDQPPPPVPEHDWDLLRYVCRRCGLTKKEAILACGVTPIPCTESFTVETS